MKTILQKLPRTAISAGATWVMVAVAYFPTFSALGMEGPELLLSEVRAAYQGINTLRAEVVLRKTVSGEVQVLQGRAFLKKPNLARLELEGPRGTTIVSDGSHQWILISEAQRCLKSRVPHPRSLRLLGAKPLSLFFSGHSFTFGQAVKPESVRRMESATVNGVPCKVVEVTSRILGSQRIQYFIGPDALLLRMIAELEFDGQQLLYEVELRDLNIDDPIATSRFQFLPPPGLVIQDEEQATHFVGVGDVAPDFTLYDVDGRPVSLETTRRRARAVLLNFWFLRCAPCLAELPHLANLYEDLKSQGLEVLVINASDKVAAVRRFRNEKGYRFPMVVGGLQSEIWKLLEVKPDGILTEYDVKSFPTNLLVDQHGKVVLRMSGFDEAPILRALSELGIESSEK